jgi:hypothetical protein
MNCGDISSPTILSSFILEGDATDWEEVCAALEEECVEPE